MAEQFAVDELSTSVALGSPAPPGKRESRARLLDLSVGLVENLRRAGSRGERSPEDFCVDFQVCLPYHGLFVWHVAGDDIVGDPNQAVFVRAGEGYRMSAPVTGGYGELIITPDVGVLAEIACATGGSIVNHPLFRRRSRLVSPSLQSYRTRFLHWASTTRDIDHLQGDEVVMGLLRATFDDDGRRRGTCGPTTTRLMRRTKEFLQAQLSRRVRLADIGRAVGASPAYLTDVFSRVEGVSLHQYLTQLRLGRALAELANADDLTALALETGFSSHSHFSAAFRRAIGCTPSEFRQMSRRGISPRADWWLKRSA